MTLVEIGRTGFGFEDENSYTYTYYYFIDDKENEYEMKYYNDALKVEENKEYIVTFEVKKDTLGYNYTLISIR